MITVTIIFYVFAIVALLAVASIHPKQTAISRFEIERRAANGDNKARLILRREDLLRDVYSVQKVKIAVLLVIITTLSIVIFGWALGIVISALIAMEFGAVARWPFIQRGSQKLYEKYEPKIIDLVERFPRLFALIRSAPPDSSQSCRVSSREELTHVIEQSNRLLSDDERRLMTHSLEFNEKPVGNIMTPRSAIDTVSKKELLGPLVLDDLHKTGHSRFPVIDEDIDHVIGLLHVQDMLSLDIKRSVTAEKAMEPRVYYIREDQTLGHALTAFTKTRHHLFIVINESRETVGILSLEDVIEALLGRKISDEFDSHDDLHAVAQRDVRRNNPPRSYLDV